MAAGGCRRLQALTDFGREVALGAGCQGAAGPEHSRFRRLSAGRQPTQACPISWGRASVGGQVRTLQDSEAFGGEAGQMGLPQLWKQHSCGGAAQDDLGFGGFRHGGSPAETSQLWGQGAEGPELSRAWRLSAERQPSWACSISGGRAAVDR